MLHAFSRSEELLGKEGLHTLADARVAVFGIGGVGSYVTEALARAGVGTLILVDHDEVSLTNLNRQLVALRSTMGRKKVLVAKERIMDINQDAVVHTYDTFFSKETAGLLILPHLIMWWMQWIRYLQNYCLLKWQNRPRYR